MPNGVVHTKATFFCSLILPASYYVATGNAPESFMLFGGCAAGLLITPDLDVNRGSYSAFIIKILGGEFISRVWLILWKPYSMIPHRSFWSHSIIISTLLRVLYSLFLFLLPLGIIRQALVDVQGVEELEKSMYEFLPFLAGLAIVDSLHIIMDFTTTKIKRFRWK